MAELAPRLRFSPADRIRVVRYGIDPAAWTPTGDGRERARSALGLTDEAVVVVCTSRLIRGKGQDTLIRAFATARTTHPDLHLLVAGTGSEDEPLRRLAAELLPEGSYRFTGFVPDVRNVIWAADIFVLPTHADLGEGFGIALIEAAAAHVPVVASDHGPLRELVEPGSTGLIVTPGADSELADALIGLAGDPELRARLAEAASERIRAGFTQDATTAATAAVYRELVDRDP